MQKVCLFGLWTLACFFISINVIAQTTSNTNNPDWDNGGDWSGAAPGYDMQRSAILANNSNISDPITVNDGYTLTINAGVTLTTNEVITVKEGGTLIINGNLVGTDGGKEFKVEKGVFTVNSGGSFDWAGYWTSNDNPATITIDGSMNVDGDLTNSVTIGGSGQLTVQGTVENNGTIGGSTGNDTGTLPIELTSFQAEQSESGLRVFWESAVEVNNDFYLLERSYDGKNWTELVRLAGAGNSDQPITYEFFDIPPAFGRVYYRLTQTDFDGTSETFPLITANYKNPEGNKVKAYPTLVTSDISELRIDDIWGIVKDYELNLYDLNGKVYEVAISSTQNGYIAVPLQGRSTHGLHILRGHINGTRITEKFIFSH